MRRLNEERGFTLVEIMVAVVVLLVGALGTLAMLDTANKRSRSAADRQSATAVARQVLEAAKGVPYREITPGTIVTRLRQDSSIAGVSGNPWRIARDGTTFTVQVQVCWLDEPSDGLGSHAAGGYCAESGTAGNADGNPIDHKRLTVVTSWDNDSGAGSSRQSTLVSARGGSDAPGVSSVRLTSPTTPAITDPATATASFAVTTTDDAASVIWSLDGTQQGTAVGTQRNWTFSWELPDNDGVYDVSAQAFDTAGLGGEVRSVTVVVNRFAPFAPENMVAARNNGVVETSWSANRERDVIGYRVYRQGTGAAEVACNFTTETSCIDTSAPPNNGSALEYWVVAIDRDPSDQEREGDPSSRVNVNVANTPPNPPTALTLSKDAQGNSVLRWAAPSVPDADPGDFIDAYAIYRDGTAIADRYDQVAGTDTTWTDHATAGVTHQYWVVSIDSRFVESSPLGPVTG